MFAVLCLLLCLSALLLFLCVRRLKKKKRLWASLFYAVWAAAFLFVSLHLCLYVGDAAALPLTKTVGDGETWMSALSDDLPISEVNIPGTHDSGTADLSLYGEVFSDAALRSILQTQHLSIQEQLSAGIRLFDLRFVEEDGDFVLYHSIAHGRDENKAPLTVTSVIETAEAFLTEHPEEFLLFMYQPEEDTDDAWYEREASLKASFHTEGRQLLQEGDPLPTVGEARGKIFLFSSSDICKWEDHYTASPEEKIDYLTEVFSLHTPQSTAPVTLSSDPAVHTPKIVYTTTYTARKSSPLYAPFLSLIPSPRGAAARIQPWLLAYSFVPEESYGWILLNFASPETAAVIYTSNFQ